MGRFITPLLLFWSVVSAQSAEDNTYTVKCELKNGDIVIKETYKNDKLNVEHYILSNGLQVYIVPNHKEPLISTRIIFNVGAKHDPVDNTGLAHYLEHLMMNGTSNIGTSDYVSEKKYLDKIEILFEKHKNEKDTGKKKKIRKEIDKLSYEASKYLIPSEFDGIMDSLGCTNVNAETSYDSTTFTSTVPSNMFEKWCIVEREELFNPSFRRFNSELEIVYEEYNRDYDSGYANVYDTICKKLFPSHPCGWHGILGSKEHLKNPSLTSVKDFYNTYYVPNNCCIVLSGDINDNCIELINKHFGNIKSKKIPVFEWTQDNCETHEEVNMFSETDECVFVAYRLDLKNFYNDSFLTDIMCSACNLTIRDQLLKNHALQYAELFQVSNCNDCRYLVLFGVPLRGQSLKSVKEILLNATNEFFNISDSVFEGHVNTYESNHTKSLTDIDYLSDRFGSLFVNNVKYGNIVQKDYHNLSKQDLVNFMKTVFSSDRVIVNKCTGNRDIDKVELNDVKPLTKSRQQHSKYFSDIENIRYNKISPVVPDYNGKINVVKLNEYSEILYTKNEDNSTFKIKFEFNYGINKNKYMSIFNYFVQYLNSDKITYNELNKTFINLGIGCHFNTYGNDFSFELSGLSKFFEKAINSLSLYLTCLKPSNNCVDSGKQYCEHLYNNRGINANDILKYVTLCNYKELNVSNIDVKKFDISILKKILNELLSSFCRVYIYTDIPLETVSSILKKSRILDKCKNKESFIRSEHKKVDSTRVYIVDSSLPQVKCSIITPIDKLKSCDYTIKKLYSKYIYSSICDKLRMSESFTYDPDVRLSFIDPASGDNDHFAVIFSTQSGKLGNALKTATDIINNMPINEYVFRKSSDFISRVNNSTRINGYDLLDSYMFNKSFGIDLNRTCFLKESIEKSPTITLNDIVKFHDDRIKDAKRLIIIFGDINDMNIEELSQYGEIRQISIGQVLNNS